VIAAAAAYDGGMALPQRELLREIPPVDALVQSAEARLSGHDGPRRVLVDAIRSAAAAARRAVQTGELPEVDAEALREIIMTDAQSRVAATLGPFYRKVVNTTGIILHTALGRAVLPSRAVCQIARELSGYSLLQADIETGGRARRDERIEELLKQLTGAEAATVVNNNAAATAIVLNSVAAGKEVLVSRGQLVEIGGSFRLPDVMTAAGVKLVEVGTTNKTHLRDYQQAITPNTAAILRVHPSNYKIEGFTAEVPLEALVGLGRERGLTVIDDVGAGALIDYSRFGFQKEPTLPESVAAGADLVTCSADKMIGGPQGGIILGKAAWIQAIRKNPLARIVRVDKLSLAALEATLVLFLDEAWALDQVPTLRMLCRGLADIDAQARRIAAAIVTEAPDAEAAVIDGFSQMGSGSLPAQNLPTRVVAVASPHLDAGEIARRLRHHTTPVFARVHDGQVLADPRTLLDGDEVILVAAFHAALTIRS
jgi:L-seryl-tRNA(Ser) seleniumtransferase